MHTLISHIFYKLCSVAIPRHPKPLPLENHVTLTPNLQGASIYSVLEFLYYSSTTKLILFLILYKGVLSELYGLTPV